MTEKKYDAIVITLLLLVVMTVSLILFRTSLDTYRKVKEPKIETIIIYDTVYVGAIKLDSLCYEIWGSKNTSIERCNK